MMNIPGVQGLTIYQEPLKTDRIVLEMSWKCPALAVILDIFYCYPFAIRNYAIKAR